MAQLRCALAVVAAAATVVVVEVALVVMMRKCVNRDMSRITAPPPTHTHTDTHKLVRHSHSPVWTTSDAFPNTYSSLFWPLSC